LVDFATHGGPLVELGIKVVAGSIDPLEKVQTLRTGLHVGFPMWGELDGPKVSADTGAPIRESDGVLHGSAWLVNPDGEIVQSLYSTGPIGRFTASDVIRKVVFEKNRA